MSNDSELSQTTISLVLAVGTPIKGMGVSGLASFKRAPLRIPQAQSKYKRFS